MKNVIDKGKLSALGLLVFCGMLTACSTNQSATRSEMQPVMLSNQNFERHVPGTVEYIWEEPMINVVDVPPGLDPEGHYYRPAHQSIVEIRQGRWQYYRDR